MLGRVNGKVKHVWSRDPALDRDAPELEGALEAYHNGEQATLPTKEGRQLVVWTLISLTDRAYRELTRTSLLDGYTKWQEAMQTKIFLPLIERATYAERYEAARRGIVTVENALDGEGRPFTLKFDDGAGGKVVTGKSMEAIHARFGPRLIAELGQRVIDMCEMDPT
jgi:hypothetical protein